MFGSLGGSEIVMILGLALLLFGPRKLPEIGRQIGRTMGQFRRAATDFKLDLEKEVRADEIRETDQTLKSVGRDLSRPFQAPAPEAAPTAGTPADPSPDSTPTHDGKPTPDR